jgi:hypothetical protein
MDYSTQKVTKGSEPIPNDPIANAMVNNNPNACLKCKPPLVLTDTDPYHTNGPVGRCVPSGLCVDQHTRVPVPNCFCDASCTECLGPGKDQCTGCPFKQLLVQVGNKVSLLSVIDSRWSCSFRTLCVCVCVCVCVCG